MNYEEVTPSQNVSSNEDLTVEDKIILLRYSFAPLLIFELAMGTLVAVDEEYKSQFAGETKFISLPNGILLDFEQGFQIPNGLLTKEIVEKVINLGRSMADLKMDKEEFVLMKLIITSRMNSGILDVNELEKLSTTGKAFIQKLYSFALHGLSCKASSFRSLNLTLNFLPELMSISRELVENIKKENAFLICSSTEPFSDVLRELLPTQLYDSYVPSVSTLSVSP
uniref:NR LBD domain-containing protein n=1 Tax=Meloidogyne enterolobii TaxID=390850 RepID=A0A6V7TRM1_MELEN|nr:unnamed protein product [Meloidogyne enterolobii]